MDPVLPFDVQILILKLFVKESERRGLVQELNLGAHLFGNGKDDCRNYRCGLSNGDLRDRIVSIRQNKAKDLKRGVHKGGQNAKLSQKLSQNPQWRGLYGRLV